MSNVTVNQNNPSGKKEKHNFRLSDLVDRDRYFHVSVIGLVGVIVILVAILLTSRGSARSPAAESRSITPAVLLPADASEIEPSPVIEDPLPTQDSVEPAQTGLSQVLLSSGDMNAILDIWSSNSSDILVRPQVEFNLIEAAGRTFVTRSKDFSLSLESYHFSGDPAITLKVIAELKRIYLEELGYSNTELSCVPKSPEYSWIIEVDKDRRILLARAAGSNIIVVQLTSEAPFDKDNAAFLLCSVAEKQLESLRIAGYIAESSTD